MFHVDIIRFPSDRTYPTSLFFRRLVSRHVEMSVFCQILRMGAADVETKFVSVERVAEYMRLEGETEGSFEVVENWPQGEVKLEAETRQQ